MSETDPLREILGDDLYNELQSLETNDYFSQVLERLTPDVLDRISDTTYGSVIAFDGKEAFDLVATLKHGAETGCRDCFTSIVRFAAEVVGNMWYEILLEEGIVEEEGPT